MEKLMASYGAGVCFTMGQRMCLTSMRLELEDYSPLKKKKINHLKSRKQARVTVPAQDNHDRVSSHWKS